ncbi:uncharacterized protein LOC128647672 isoform X2 [Bombina bombina]|uniref:uncharacterized protein LOC128647672 isoform X2 n=1 Tax=Bombina bombina TaxID=8345 RepID=UPI00235AEF33|nr:uncharacterized protein LOC128647672 isoform X2 [Bombina bombina]
MEDVSEALERVAIILQVQAAVMFSGVAGRGRAPKKIWIVGHSFVHWASLRALASRASIRWLGHRGLCWQEFPGLIQEAHRRWGHTDIVVLHLGGNDLEALPTLELISIMGADIRWLHAWLPGLKVGWSCVIPRLHWRHVESHKAAFGVRKKLNRDIGKVVSELGAFVVRHSNISSGDKSLY